MSEDQKKLDRLPEGYKLVGMYKLKDKDKRDIISFPVGPEVEGIIIQKVRGVSNKIIVLVKLYDKAKLDEASRKLQVLTDIENKNKPKEEVKNEESIKS
jgi:hypothetical protein